MITLVHVDGRPLLREGLKATLSPMKEYSVVGVGSTLHEAIALVQTHKPDILILDFNIQGNGFEAAKIVSRLHAGTRTLFLAPSGHPEHILAALDAGAMGYVKDTATAADIADGLRTVMDGRRFIWPKDSNNLLNVLSPERASEPELFQPVFTGRELDVVHMLKDGFTNKEIADGLGISEKTVKHHVSIIMHKLSVRNRVEATRAILKRFGDVR